MLYYVKRRDGIPKRDRLTPRMEARQIIDALDAARAARPARGAGEEWCPVCHTHHVAPGEKTDAGGLVRVCPQLAADDPRNQFKNYPLSVRDRAIVGAAQAARDRRER